MGQTERIRVIICEDEPLILNNIVKKVQAVSAVFQVTGTAADGAEALLLLEQADADLLITDIHVPVMNGLELLKTVSLRFPHVKKIVISGYNEFEYARQALRCDVVDYLLKPPKMPELEEVLGKVRMMLEAEKSVSKTKKLLVGDNYTYSPEQIVEMVRLLIKSNFDQELTLEQISREFNFTPSYLTKIFIKHTGEPPSKYMITLRINEAKHMLRSRKELSVKEVGEMVGYPNPYYFSRIFKQIAGVTPSEYKTHDLHSKA